MSVLVVCAVCLFDFGHIYLPLLSSWCTQESQRSPIMKKSQKNTTCALMMKCLFSFRNCTRSSCIVSILLEVLLEVSFLPVRLSSPQSTWTTLHWTTAFRWSSMTMTNVRARYRIVFQVFPTSDSLFMVSNCQCVKCLVWTRELGLNS